MPKHLSFQFVFMRREEVGNKETTFMANFCPVIGCLFIK